MELSNVHYVALWGFLIAVVFGAVAFKTNFCTMGAVSDWVNMGDKTRLRSWFLAIGVAIIGAQTLQYLGYVDLGSAIYLTSNFGWLGHLLGGLLFGVGMTLGSGCGQRTCVRLGGGNLKSLVVLLMIAVVGYMTLRGLLALVRIGYIEVSNVDLTGYGMQDQSMASAIAAFAGIENANAVRIALAAVLGIGFVIYAFKDSEFRSSFDNILAGVVIGLCVVAGWYVTGALGKDEFDPVAVESYTFVAPVANSLQYLMTYTGSVINFGIAAVFGVIAGAFVYSVITGKFRVEYFSGRSDMTNHLIGGALMGFGGVIALGCTIGQAVTGMSTLAIGSAITMVSIIFGSAVTMKIQYYMMDEQGFLTAFHSALADLRLLPARKSAA